MRFTLTVILMASGSAVQAHPGHLADLAGHDHWVAGAAIGLAVLAGLYGALTGKSEAEEDPDPETSSEEEAPA